MRASIVLVPLRLPGAAVVMILSAQPVDVVSLHHPAGFRAWQPAQAAAWFQTFREIGHSQKRWKDDSRFLMHRGQK